MKHILMSFLSESIYKKLVQYIITVTLEVPPRLSHELARGHSKWKDITTKL